MFRRFEFAAVFIFHTSNARQCVPFEQYSIAFLFAYHASAVVMTNVAFFAICSRSSSTNESFDQIIGCFFVRFHLNY